MICVSDNKDQILSALDQFDNSVYLNETIKLYLDSYGTKFDFCQVYLQNIYDFVSAIVLRYNNILYCVTNSYCNFDELFLFLMGLSCTEIFVDNVPVDFTCKYNLIKCYEMCKSCFYQSESDVILREITDSKSLMLACNIVCADKSSGEVKEFFLDTSHLVRHNLIKVFGIFKCDRLVSAAGVSCNLKRKVILFLATDHHFRGNGYGKYLLDCITDNSDDEYYLLCSKENLIFYEKCGFSVRSFCYKIKF